MPVNKLDFKLYNSFLSGLFRADKNICHLGSGELLYGDAVQSS